MTYSVFGGTFNITQVILSDCDYLPQQSTIQCASSHARACY